MIQNTYNMRSAFSIITAIFVIVLMASVAAFIMNLTGKMLQETTTQYRKEQAILFAKSYTEFALMAATARNCIQSVDAHTTNPAGSLQGNGYWIQINAQYIGNELAAVPNCDTVGGAITNVNSRGGILMLDTYVRYRDPENPNIGLPWAQYPGATYHRRTLQRL